MVPNPQGPVSAANGQNPPDPQNPTRLPCKAKGMALNLRGRSEHQAERTAMRPKVSNFNPTHFHLMFLDTNFNILSLKIRNISNSNDMYTLLRKTTHVQGFKTKLN